MGSTISLGGSGSLRSLLAKARGADRCAPAVLGANTESTLEMSTDRLWVLLSQSILKTPSEKFLIDIPRKEKKSRILISD